MSYDTVHKDQRRQVSDDLTPAPAPAEGLSTRAIAPTVGKDHSTIVRDKQVVQPAPPAPAPAETIAPTVGTGTTQVHRDKQVFQKGTPAPVPAEATDPDTGEIIYDQPEPTRPTNPHDRPRRRSDQVADFA